MDGSQGDDQPLRQDCEEPVSRREEALGGRAEHVRHEALCLYPRLSREELGRRFLGQMTYLDPKGEGDNSMSENQ
ncbi:hypothetical protein ACFYWY_37235 [Streptomyces sp. NPDC002870]|uniref:hypothetical protein n=1 Tax=Streptomyces sp. NPDC002870 TaxID=3364666 RepID=UPI003684C623